MFGGSAWSTRRDSCVTSLAGRRPFAWVGLVGGSCCGVHVWLVVGLVLREFLNDFVVVYVDDILIFSENEKQHLHHLEKVLKRLQQHDLKCKPHKCSFGKPEVDFLGFIVGNGKLRLNEKVYSAVMNWPTPKDISDVRSFMGFLNHYRKFIKNLSGTSGPLSHLQSPKIPWEWGKEQENAFREL